MRKKLALLLGIMWASPNTLLGLLLGVAGLCTGGHGRVRGRTIEFYGGGIRTLITRLPHGDLTLAFTLGHVILGQSEASLDVARKHELVHVRQYERWGPLTLPVYAMSSLFLRLAGRDPYRDNPFERGASGGNDD